MKFVIILNSVSLSGEFSLAEISNGVVSFEVEIKSSLIFQIVYVYLF